MNENKLKGKVIVVGAQRTGTTSMGVALLELGFTVLGTPSDEKIATSLMANDSTPAIAEAAKYDAFQDLPWAFLYQELDRAFPGSKFILLIRDENSWLQSMLSHFGHTETLMRRWAYGKPSPFENEEAYLERFRRHYQEVRLYFKDRPDDLLEMSLTQGDGWEKLCPFLGLPTPGKPFPRTNKSKHNYSFSDKIYNSLRKMLPHEMRRQIMKMLGINNRRNRFNNAPVDEPTLKK
jgi:hypothetical protein